VHSRALLSGVNMPSPVLSEWDTPQVNNRFLRARGRAGGGGGGGFGQGGGGGFGGGGGGGGHGYQRQAGDRHPVADERAVQDLLSRRFAARQSRDFGTADSVRALLNAKGIEVDDRERTWTVRDPRLAGALQAPAQQHRVHGARQLPPQQQHYQRPPQQSYGQPMPHPYHAQPMPRRQPQPHYGGYPQQQHQPVPYPTAPLRQPQQHAPPPQRYGAGGGYPVGGPVRHERPDVRHAPYGHPPAAPGGYGGGGAAALLRQQLAGARPGGAPHPGARPPPMPGQSAAANQSAADLLRQQLMRK